MATWAPGTKVTRYHKAKRVSGANPTGVILHIADQAIGSSTLGYVSRDNDRNSHPTYVIQVDGTKCGVVHPDERPSSTYPGDIDDVSITIEFDNVTRAPDYQISEAQKKSAKEIIAHHAAESARAGKGFVYNDPKNTQTQYFIGGHNQYRNVACPGRTVLNWMPTLIAELNGGPVEQPSTPAPAPSPAPAKSVAQLADEVLRGQHGSGEARKRALGSLYSAVQAEVNRRLNGGSTGPTGSTHSVADVAADVIRGEWGNGDERKRRLEAAGHSYSAVMAEVNAQLKGKSSTRPVVDIEALARATIRGEYGNGAERERRLGSNYSAVMRRVNQLV